MGFLWNWSTDGVSHGGFSWLTQQAGCFPQLDSHWLYDNPAVFSYVGITHLQARCKNPNGGSNMEILFSVFDRIWISFRFPGEICYSCAFTPWEIPLFFSALRDPAPFFSGGFTTALIAARWWERFGRHLARIVGWLTFELIVWCYQTWSTFFIIYTVCIYIYIHTYIYIYTQYILLQSVWLMLNLCLV